MRAHRGGAGAAALAIVAAWLLVGCAGEAPSPPASEPAASESEPPKPQSKVVWTYDPSMLFPADGSLLRAEDGVALPGGRLLVVDQAAGARMVEPDGTSAPFGDLPGAGYRHDPPDHEAGANGISLEPGGTHALIADIYRGGIYRVDVATGDTEKVHQHRYGVNTAVRDSRGTIWFTQSAHNTPEEGGARMWQAVDTAASEGAVYRLPMIDGRLADEAELVVDGLQFGNGIVVDERNGMLYVAETMGGRVHRFPVDFDTGTVGEGEVVLEDVFPDNLEMDDDGRLWIAAPIDNAVVVLDTETLEHRTVFQVQTPAQRDSAAEMIRRARAGEPCLELFGPEAWAPLPGALTGVILTPDGGPVYASTLGNALIRLPSGEGPAD